MPLQQLQVVPHSALLRVPGSGGARLSLGQAELRGSVAVPGPCSHPLGGGSPGGRQHPQELGALCSVRGCEHGSPLLWGNVGILGSAIGLWLWFCFPIDLFAHCYIPRCSFPGHPWVLPKGVPGHRARQGGRDVTLVAVGAEAGEAAAELSRGPPILPQLVHQGGDKGEEHKEHPHA